MSLVIASTTDTQEQVNAAAGITTPQPPSEAPAPAGEPEAPQEPEPAEPDPDQDTEEQDDPEDSHKQTKRKWGAQERISRLTREKYQYQARTQELERRLAELSASRPQERPPSAPQPQHTQGEPQESQYERYEDYVRAVSRWEAAQAWQEYRRQEAAERQQMAEQMQEAEFQQRLTAYDASAPDFLSAMESVKHLKFHPAFNDAIRGHESPGELMHALAREPKELERISRMSLQNPAAALRELGKFEAKLSLNGEQAKPPAVSKAPPPISPVGQGSTRSTKPPEEMNYQEFKKWRLKNGAK